MANSSVLKIAANPTGRDFVVGDIHGAYDLVLEAMAAVRFDQQKDRLFAVGDLIDRGADSHRCAKFLAQPYVYAVRGNHEDMLISLYEGEPPDESMLPVICRFNGLNWWLGVSEEKRQEILAAIRRLPLAIEIETHRGSVGLVHADVPGGMNWQTFCAKIEAGDADVIKTCLWGRDRIRGFNQDGVQGIDRVFVGHTPQWDGLSKWGNLYAIDTGAIFGQQGSHPAGHLTMASIVAKTEILVGEPQKPPAQLFEIKTGGGDFAAPFGAYARSITRHLR